MVRAIWIKSFAAALVCVGGAWGQQSTSAPPVYNKGDTITLQEPGKAEQKVKVIKTTRTSDGKMTYEVQDMQTGDKATISESPVAMPVAEASAPKKGLLRFLSRPSRSAKKNEMSPAMTSAKKGDKDKVENQIMMPAGAVNETSHELVKPATGTTPKHKNLPKAGPSGKAMPSDWHQSWGKADDHQCPVGQTIQLTSYALMPVPEPKPQIDDCAMTIKNCSVPGNPYWHVPKMGANQPGVARVSR